MMLGVQNALGQRASAAQVRRGPGPETLLEDSRPLLARRGRSKIVPGAAFGRLGAILSVSRRLPGTALSAQNRPRPKFHRFFVDFGRFLHDVRLIFHRFWLDFHTPFALCLALLLCSVADPDR